MNVSTQSSSCVGACARGGIGESLQTFMAPLTMGQNQQVGIPGIVGGLGLIAFIVLWVR